ncbi:dihydrofolate reductase family protein [Microlunatus soli]|uniref:Dihydrofolate reductase n=1 Tax=Microlunatus soli TaxID=630515 RepID=A0A1H1UZN1_9ACTN|nr:dihydrofolate reductase family protein [Microlunatus soli]SDS77721.1 Dihydrofolate reductase [Microlunatus soli]
MARLIYSYIASLDGFVEDENGGFGWAAPDAEVHAFVNDLERPIGSYLYGRRMYETMAVWETDPELATGSPETADFAKIWKAATKIVFSRSLDAVWTADTRLAGEFSAAAVHQLKESADRDLSVGGADLAASAIRAGLVDEIHAILVPEVVGGGKRALPKHRLGLELLDHKGFGNGTAFLRYAVRPPV